MKRTVARFVEAPLASRSAALARQGFDGFEHRSGDSMFRSHARQEQDTHDDTADQRRAKTGHLDHSSAFPPDDVPGAGSPGTRNTGPFRANPSCLHGCTAPENFTLYKPEHLKLTARVLVTFHTSTGVTGSAKSLYRDNPACRTSTLCATSPVGQRT